MRKELATAAVNPAVELDDVKEYGNVNTTVDDARLTELLPAAIDYVENYTSKALINQQFNIFYDSYEIRHRMPLCGLNVTNIDSVVIYDNEGNTTTLDSSTYRLSGKKQCWIVFDNPSAVAVNMDTRQIDAMRIHVDAGFGADKTDIDTRLRTAMNMITMHWYRYNGAILDGTKTNIPHNVKTLLTPWCDTWRYIN